jgi:serine protease Do
MIEARACRRTQEPVIAPVRIMSFKRFAAFATGIVMWVSPAASQATATNDGYADLVARLWPAVVNIAVRTVAPAPSLESASGGRTVRGSEDDFVGSGFIVDPSGYIVTNRHVVINAFSITVTLSDGTRLAAKVIGHPPAIDIALLKVNAKRPLPTVEFADSEAVHIGDKVLAIGNPLGFGETVTSGIVSALNRSTGESPYDNFIQTDAAINHGNSGGPLFNLQGKVIGVDTELVTPNAASTGSIGLGLAIPSDDVAFAVAELRKYGRVRPGWIGAQLQQITPDLAAAFDLASTDGALVAAVEKGGPADDAGLRPGDVIQTFNSRAPTDVRALMRMIAESPLGDGARLTVRHGDEERRIRVEIREYPPAKMVADFPFQLTRPPPRTAGDVGLQVVAMSDAVRRRLNLPASVVGVEVAAVQPGSTADRAGLRPQDVILQIQDQVAANPDVIETALRVAQDKTLDDIRLLVVGPAGQAWLALPLAPKKQANRNQ